MTQRSNRRISLDLLLGFEASARHQSFTRAAADLFVTQSAVSRQVKTLEEQLGQALFRRINRGLELTEAGESLYNAVKGALQQVHDTVDQLLETGKAKLTVKAAAPFTSLWLVPRLPNFTSRHPDFNVRIAAADDHVDLEREKADLAILYYRRGNEPASATQLMGDEVLPVCAPALLNDRARPLRAIPDLANHVLLRLETVVRGRVRIDWIRWLQAMGVSRLRPSGVLSFSHYDQVVQAAVDGNGVALGRMPLIDRYLRDGLLAPPFPEKVVSAGAWYAITTSPNNLIAKAFVDWLREEVRVTSQATGSKNKAALERKRQR